MPETNKGYDRSSDDWFEVWSSFSHEDLVVSFNWGRAIKAVRLANTSACDIFSGRFESVRQQLKTSEISSTMVSFCVTDSSDILN